MPRAVVQGKCLAAESHLGPGFSDGFSPTGLWCSCDHVDRLPPGPSLPGDLSLPGPPTASTRLCPLGCFLARELRSTSAVSSTELRAATGRTERGMLGAARRQPDSFFLATERKGDVCHSCHFPSISPFPPPSPSLRSHLNGL